MSLLSVEDVSKSFTLDNGVVSRLFGWDKRLRAVRDISFEVGEGETLALVGESGAGKSTVGRLILRLLDPSSGEVRYRGDNIHSFSKDQTMQYRREVQMVFQDPYSSFDPRFRIGQTLRESMSIHTDLTGEAQAERGKELLELVNLSPDFYDRFPNELSGGQLQRVSIATALSTDPDLIVLDEPVSALDVSVRSSVLNLLMEIQRERNISYLFISHDLSVVRHISDRIAVMYLGEIVEEGTTDELFDDPAHPYTSGLLSSIPAVDPTKRGQLSQLTGEIPSPIDPPSGCPFHPRCNYATEECTRSNPETEAIDANRTVNCHHWQDVIEE